MNRHLYPQIRTIHVLSVIAVFAISAGILLAAQSGCIGATLAGTDGSYNTPDTELSGHAPVQAVTAGERMPDLIVACQIADTFADMLFTGVLDVVYAVHAVLSLTAVGNITDDDISLVLGGASDITTFESGGHTYAAVAAYTDYGVQILDITDPANITAVSSIPYDPNLELRGARGITTFESGVHTYAAVAAYLSDSVQILNITDPSDITPAGNIAEIGSNTDDLELYGARGITTFVSGGHTYAAVAAHLDDGVQILNITDPLHITAAGNITNTDTLELEGASGIATFESGGHTYVAVAAYDDNGVQILDVTDPLHIIPAGNITKIGSNTDDLELNGAYGITTFVSGGHTYAAVAAHLDDGVQILNITDPLHITPAGSIDTNTLALNGAQDITTFTSGVHTYVAVAAYVDNGVQILDVTDPLHITAAGNIADIGRNTDDLELYRAQGITTFTSGGHIYAAVAAYEDDGVQIIRIDIPTADNKPPVITLPGDNPTVLTVDGTYTEQGAICDDNVDADKPATPSGTVDTSTVGSHTVTYSCTDTAGNRAADVTRTVRVDAAPDNKPPDIMIPGDNPTVLIVGGMYTEQGAICGDNVDADKPATPSGTVDTSTAGTYTVTYSCTDAAGNDAIQVSRTVTVIETGAPFITTWTATSSDKDITLPMTGTYSVLWGDGSNSTNVSNSQSHTYGAAGNYTVTVLGDGLLSINLSGDAANARQLRSIEQWGGTKWTTMSEAFDGAANMAYNATDSPNLSKVNSTSSMFNGASSFDGDLSSWNVSSVTYMNNMFRGASSFNQSLNSWDVSSVADMDRMFHSASSFNQPLNDWDVSSVSGMDNMFAFATSFNQPLNDWNVSSVTDMQFMFFVATSFNQPLNDWNVSSVTNMPLMFRGASSFNGTLSDWDVSSVTDMTNVFRYATSFNQPLNDWNVSSVTDMTNVFRDATSFNQPLNDWNVSSVTDMTNVFRDATSFNQPLNSWDVSSVIDMNSMFSGASSFNGTLSGWNVSSVEYMDSMFYSATSFNQALNNWNVSSVTDMTSVFNGATSFDQLLNNWDVSSVSEMGHMFADASLFDQPLNSWNVSSVDHMNSMFADASSFNGTISDWNVSRVTDMTGMFSRATSFDQPLNSWNVSSVDYMTGMFSRATAFDQNLGNWYVVPADTVYANSEGTLNVTTISTQNAFLDGHSTSYGIDSGDSLNLFNITGSNTLMFKSAQSAGTYNVNVTASGTVVFSNGNNWRLLEIRVTGQTTDATPPDIKIPGSANVQLTVGDTYIERGAVCEDNVDADKAATVGGHRVDTSTPGQYTVTYDCTDSSNNEATQVSRTVTVGAFITTWKTTTADKSITLPLVGTNMTINWGDGNTTTASGPVSHTYNTAGDYIIQITGGLERFHLNAAADASKLVSIDQWGSISWTNMSNAFAGASNMTYNAADVPDLSGVTNMTAMFFAATAFNGNLSSWNVSSVTDMSSMFADAAAFNGPIDDWNVSSVTDMSGMFRNATAFNGPIDDWNVSSVTDMSGMFRNATAFNGPIDDWNVSSVTTMNSMFFGASVFNANLSAWNVSSVTDMYGMFEDASVFNANLSAWNVSSVTTMNNMFYGARAFDEPIDGWNVSSVTNMIGMFGGGVIFNQSLDSWNVSSVTNMHSMFFHATDFDQPLDGWDVSSVTSMKSMFNGASAFNANLSAWNVSSVTNMHNMFNDASTFNANLSAWNVSSVTDMGGMFRGASVFDGSLDAWDVSLITTMKNMFFRAINFDQPLDGWDVSSVTDMSGMFASATSFNRPLDGWDVSSVTAMSFMFDNAHAFDQNLGNWYVVPDSTSIALTAVPGVVGSISTQNTALDGHSPVYNVTGSDPTRFTIVNDNQLSMTSVDNTKSTYTVNVTASGDSVFENGNNWRLLEITVSGSTNSSLGVLAGDDQTVGEGDTVTLSGSAPDPDSNSMTYTWSQTNPDAPPITFTNASASSTTFVAPAVTGDTTFTLVLTAHDGTQSAADALNVTVRETSAAFITTWTATSSDKGITLPMDGTYSVLWGDDIYSPDVIDSQLHSYDVAGTYNVTVLGDNLKYIRLSGDIPNALQLESIEQWGGTEWTTMYEAFDGAANMVYRATDAPNLSNVTSTSGMFWGASSFDGDLSGWNVSNVTDMFSMFSSASSFNQTLNSWDVSSVTDMSYMFFGASSFDQPLNDWDVSSVTDMSAMFEDATSFNQPLNRWNVSSVIRMGMIFMFHNADDFDQNLGNWYVVPDNTSIASSNVPGVVGSISAQNMHLDSHNPVYNVTGGDSTRFAIVNGNQLNMTSVEAKSAYKVNVTASGTNVFEDGNNWRLLEIEVTDQTTDTTPPAIDRAVAASLNSITVRFSENVNADATDGSHWSLGRTDAGSLTVSANTNPAGSSNSTVTLTLSGDLPDTGPDLSLIYIKPTTGGIADGTSGKLEGATTRRRSWRGPSRSITTPPAIDRAVAASLNSVTVRFSENVNADATDGSHWSLGRTDAGSLTVSANTNPAGSSNSMTLTLSGDLPDTGPDLSLIYIKPTTGGITDGTNQLEGATVTVEDGIAPTVLSVEAVTSRSIAVRMSEPVTSGTAGPGGFSLTTGGTAPAVSSISVSGETVTLTLSGPLPAGAVTLNYDSTSGNMADVSDNTLADFLSVAVDTSADTTPPAIDRAVAASLNSVTVRFSENVNADATDGSHWSLGRTDAGSLTVSANTNPAGSSNSMTLTLSGDLPDTGPDLSLIYIKPTTGGITDGTNQLEGATVTVEDGIAPTVLSVEAVTSRSIAVRMSEPVTSGTAGPGGFSLTTGGTAPAVSSISVSGETVTLTLSGPLPAGAVTLNYDSTSGNMADVSDNTLADFLSVAVDTSADTTPPAIDRAVAASLNSVTVRFSENVNADATDGSHWSLGRTDAGSLTVSANTNPAGSSNSMTLTLSGDLPDTGPDLSLIYIKPTTGGITDGTNQLEGATVTVEDGIAPTVLSVEAVTSRSIAVRMSEPVTSGTAGPGGFSLTTGGTAPAVSSISVSGETVTLTLSGPLPAGAVTLNYDSTSGNVADVSDNTLADFLSVAVDTSADTTPPAIDRAVAASLNSVTVRFSENVNADATDGSHWSLGRTDAGSLTVSANTNPAGSSNSMTLTLSGDLPDTGPDLSLIYIKPTTGGITDGTNQLEGATVTVEDGIAPTVLSVEAVTSRSIAVRMSEPVTSGTAGPGGFSLTTGGTAPAVSSISVSGETVTLTLSGPLPAGAVTLNYDSTSGNVADVSDNTLADFSSVAVDTSADTTPPAIDRAVAASLNSVTVRFSENVNADATDGSHWSLGRTDAGSLTVSANTNPAGSSNSMTLTLSGDLPDTGPDLSLIYIKPTTGGITDGTNQLEGATVTVEDGIAPTVLSVEAVTSRSIAVRMSEPVTSGTAGPGGFSLTTGGTAPAVSSISVSGETVTLTLSGPLPAGAVTLNYDSTSGNVADVSDNTLADFSSVAVDTSADTTPPAIDRAVAASLNSVTVRFSENVNADATDGSHWSLGRTDAGSLTVSANTNPAGSSNSMTLTLSGDLPDTGPDLSLIYIKPTTGGITDGTNQLEGETVTVEDGIAPTVLSVEAVTSRSIAVRMSEPVTSGTAGPGGFSLTTGGTAPAVSSISVSGETVTLTLSGPLPAGAVTLNYDSTSGNVADVSDNTLADFSSVAVDTSADTTPPAIDRAVAASLNSVTVRFSENVNADATDGSHWSLGRTDAGSLTVSANTNPAGSSNSMTLTLSGDLPDTGPDLSLIYIKPTTGGITDGTNQLEGETVTVEDGIAPTVLSVEAVTSRSIAVRMSEPVTSGTAGPGGFSLTTGGTAPAVSSISVSGETVTLTLSGPLPAGAVTLNYDSTSGNVADVSDNTLADFSSVAVDTSADTTPPAIDRAVAASLNSVTVRFSENVNADATDGSHWSLGRTDAGSLTVSANTNPAGSSNSMTLTLSGDLPDTGPDLSLIYIKPTTGGITDGTNQLEGETVTVEDGIAPTVLSVEAVTSRSIAVRMSEPVTSGTAGPGGFSLTTGGTAPAVSSISVSGETVTLTLSGPLPAGAVTLNYDSTSGNVADVSDNTLADFSSVAVDTSADTTPPAIDRAVAASLNSVTVRFSENVNADATDGSHWSLGRTDAGSLTVSANTNPAGSSNSMTLTLSGDLPDTGPDLSLIYIKPTTGGITDGTNQLEGATVTVEDGIAPTVLSVEAVTSRSIAVRMSEPVTSGTAGPGGFSLTTGGTAPAVSSISVSGETVTLTLSGPLPAGAVTLNYDSTSGNVADVSDNTLADFSSVAVDTSADTTPPAIDRAVAASLNSVTVRFSENVNADATDGSHWSLGRTDAGSLTVSANTNPAGSSNSMTLTLSGDLPDTGPDLSLIYIKPTTGGITDHHRRNGTVSGETVTLTLSGPPLNYDTSLRV